MTLIYLSLAWIAGIIVGQNAADMPGVVWLAVAALSAAGAVLFRRNRTRRLILVCVAAGALGALRIGLANAPPGPGALASYNGQGWRVFEGIIVAEPDVRDQQVNLRVAMDSMTDGADAVVVRGTALVQAPRYGDYAYGDRVRVAGTPLTPPEFDDFSYRDYLARQGVYTLIPNAGVEILSRGHGDAFTEVMLSLKRRAQQTIAAALPEPQASLLTGILLGVETGIAPDVREAFNLTGAAHVIAISGFNMTLLASLLSRSLKLVLPRRRGTATAISAAAILVYTLFVGAGPSVVRAAIMSILLIVAPLFRRRVYTPASLAFAALVMSALDPFVLWDVGFQLSFAAVLGLALFTSPLEDGFRRLFSRLFRAETAERLLRLLSEPLIVSLAAQITTLPLIMLYFGRVSLVSLIVNLLILPVQPPILVLGGLATLIGLVVAPLALPVYWVSWLFLAWTVEVVRVFARLPGASLSTGVDERLVALFFVGVALWAILRGTRPAWLRKVRPLLQSRGAALAVLAAGAATAALLWIAAFQLPDGLLHVSFLDSGHSNAVLIETPHGTTILIDGGRYPTRLLTALGDHLPFWEREIDLLVLTQPKDAQFAAVPAVLERYVVRQVLANGQASDTENFIALQQAITGRGIPVLTVTAGYAVETSDGVRLDVLHPQLAPGPGDEPESAGLVLRVSYGQASFLLMPDLNEAAEAALLASGRDLHGTVLQLPSHGANRVSGAAFLAAAVPQVAVVQVDPGNRFGHPAADVVARLGDTPLYRTDEQGAVEFATDGQMLWISTSRN